MPISRDELNEMIFRILGKDHSVSVAINEGSTDLTVEEVFFTVMATLVERIDHLEGKIEGKGVH